MSVDRAEVNSSQIFAALESVSLGMSLELDLDVDSVVDHYVKSVTELLRLVSTAPDNDFSGVLRLESTTSLHDTPYTVLILRESSVLCWDLRVVRDGEALRDGLKNVGTLEV